jgi:asparagine synthase (glutamine-hydrolysing)
MCGIAGMLRQDGGLADSRLVRRMTEILAHRGPDGSGCHVAGAVGLGHRRLAIIDLLTGSQPMATADGATWITYNGEVYNYATLRRDLKDRGHSFRTDSDTEVVLVAYQEWGVHCLTRLRGMFAFGIWDGHRRQMFLARDRVGIKPLVYAWDGRSLRFASEIKALLEDPGLSRDLDWDALRDYLIHHYIPAPRTIFQGIRKLPPASYLLCSADGGEPVVEKYWDLQFAPERGRTEADWTEELREVVQEATRLHMVSDVPVGAFLSGGIDSSSVVACMANVSSSPVKTFSIGFDESDFDELKYARVVAARYGTEHFELVVKPDVMSILPRLAWQFDEPFGDASAVPSYCVAKITKEHVTVALSGDGGDESFAGYRRYAWALDLHRRMDRTPLCMLKPLLRWTGARRSPGARGREFLQVLGMDPLDRYDRGVSYQSAETLGWLLKRGALERMTPPTLGEEFARLAAASGSSDYLSQLQYIDVHHYLPDDILNKVDRTSMLTSLETRVPLLDHVVMEHAARIPSSLKLGATGGKHVFKRAMRPYLSEEILSRKKMGFGVPLAAWFRGTLRHFAHDLLLDDRARQRGIVDSKAVAEMLAAHVAGTRDHSAPLWALICFELWSRTWLDR